MDTLDKIIYLLKQKHKTQTDLTNHLNIHANSFTSWKSGKSTSYIKHIGKIADFLDVSTDYLLDSEINKTKDEELKFALFGGSEGITDVMLDEVKNFAKLVEIREKQKRNVI